MDLAFNAEELAFQKEVRDWITANIPVEVAEESRRSRSSHVSKERLLQWQRKLAEKGWLVPNWPKEYGGTGWSSTQKFIFEMEFYSKLASGQNPGPLSSMIKLRGTEVMQQVQEFAVEAAGWYSMPFPEQRAWNANVEPIGPEGADVLAPRYFNGRKMTIYGGSSEVQRGIMSKVMLGL